MLECLASAIDTGDPKAILAAVRLEQRRAALLGLDAPRQHGTLVPTGTGAVNIIVNAAIDEWPDPPQVDLREGASLNHAGAMGASEP
jgi:hypothetical protein